MSALFSRRGPLAPCVAGLVLAAAALCSLAHAQPVASSVDSVAVQSATPVRHADFGQQTPSPALRQMALWVAASRDNGALPFVIIDKVAAVVFVFDAEARVLGASPALLGSAVGDESAPGVGNKPLSAVLPQERTTPAGRFVASLDRNLHGTEILWVDYDAAISLHPVVAGTPKERRAERLASPSALDKRISFGCINVPPRFFSQVVRAAFTGTDGIVYILPETHPVMAFFGANAVAPEADAATAK